MKFSNLFIMLLLTFSLGFFTTPVLPFDQWPTERDNTNPVNGTLGEYRSNWFHLGIDIKVPRDTLVVPATRVELKTMYIAFIFILRLGIPQMIALTL